MATPEQPQRDELIAAVKSMAPFPILMATFMLIYAVWFGVGHYWLGGLCTIWCVCGMADFLRCAAYPCDEKIAQASTNASQQADR